MNEIAAINAARMSSIEIAELVESRHSDIKRSIKRLVEKGIIRQPPTAHTNIINDLGVITGIRDFYVFEGEQGKRDSIIVVAQNCPEFTARLVDRWMELEKRMQLIGEIKSTDEVAALKCEIARLKAQIWKSEEVAAGERRINEIITSRKSTDQKLKEMTHLAKQNWNMRCEELQERVELEQVVQNHSEKIHALECVLEANMGIEFKQ